MAKKLLAVVLAVLIAVSAMAVTVFADKQIPLYKAADSNYTTFNVTFDIPVYGLYGYLTAGDYMLIDLPKDWFGNNEAKEVKWSIVVNGMSFALPTIENPHSWGAASTQQAKVTLAYLTHDFDGRDTAIPQTTGFNTVSSFRLVAEMKTPTHDAWRVDLGGLFTNDNASYRTLAKAQWYHEDGSEVPGSLSYAYSWNPQVTNATGVDLGTYDFVTKEWSSPDANDESVPLTWDHTLQARADIMGAESAELVVELTKDIVGQATYTLYANIGDATYQTNYQNLWWQYNASRKFVDAVTVDGKSNKLTFKVPVNILYETTYGSYNRQFVIFENITLMNNTIMKDYMTIDRAKVGGDGGTLGRLSWNPSYAGDRARYDGADINYARTGIAGKGSQGAAVLNVVGLTTVSFDAMGAKDTEGYNGYVIKNTGIKIEEGATYVFEAPVGKTMPSGVEFKAGEGQNVAENAWEKRTRTYTAAQFIEKGAKVGDEIVVIANNWDGNAYDAFTVKVTANTTSYNQLTSDVMAKTIYLNLKETEVVPAPDTTPNTPTEAGDNEEEVEGGDNVSVEDNTPAPETNPGTGVALAVVPMLVAAVAAVVAKKH